MFIQLIKNDIWGCKKTEINAVGNELTLPGRFYIILYMYVSLLVSMINITVQIIIFNGVVDIPG